MHNLWMNMVRYKALVLALTPFLVAGSLWLLMNNDESWGKIGYLLLLIASMPILAAMSVASVVAAFSKKDPERRWKETAKFLSIISVLVFGTLTVFGLIGVITSMMGIG